MNSTDPITLCTDASDFGIGGYLYQTIDSVDHPIASISKSLSDSHIRWAIVQKVTFPIFYCSMQLESLFRDRKFLILSDHKNLIYTKEASKPMVIRWYMALFKTTWLYCWFEELRC